EFREGQVNFTAFIPSDQLWVAVKDILVYEEYEMLPQFRLSSLSSDAIVFDAGSFVGLYSLKASSYAARVVAIEPNPISFQHLIRNIRMNGVRNVEPLKVGLSDRSGSSFFHDHETGSLLARTGEFVVDTTTLDKLCDEFPHVD